MGVRVGDERAKRGRRQVLQSGYERWEEKGGCCKKVESLLLLIGVELFVL